MSRIRLKSLFYLLVIIQYFSLVRLSVCEEVIAEESADDELISKLLDMPVSNTAEESEVSHILKILEAGEQAATTEGTGSIPSSTEPTSTTTSKPSPFFKTQRPYSFSSRSLEETDAQLNSIISTLMESQALLDSANKTEITKRSDSSHFPPLDSLLLSTAEALWDVSKPAFYRTKTGRKVSLLQDSITLPLRTFGHLKHKILDLTSGPNKKRSIHHHGWGWSGDEPVYIKYEPENSLFKAWIRTLYKSLRPVVISKIRLKKKLIRIKLRLLGGVIRFLKSAKLQKFLVSIRALIAYLRSLRPNLVVLKEAGHSHGWGWPASTSAPPTKGWGWSPPSQGWGSGGWARQSPAAPTSASMYGPPPTQDYSYAASSPPEMSYGPPAQTSYGQRNKPYQNYGAPTPRPSPEAYNQDNIYSNYYSPPSQELMAPEQLASGSEHVPKEDSPSYAKYLKQFGINPSSLSDSGGESVRTFRETRGKPDDVDDDVPYLSKSAENDVKLPESVIAESNKEAASPVRK